MQPDVNAMLHDLRQLVEVESPSGDLEALQASAGVVAEILQKRLGGEAVLVESAAGPHIRWSGGGEPRVLILGHHDTVFPIGTLARRPFLVEDGKAYGPGTFDMLGGLVQAVHGLALLPDLSGVEVLVTSDEEVGSGASRELIEQLAQECGAVLVFEGAGEGGALKTGRKGCGTFEVSITGRASHAGLEPEAGVNALVEAAHQVLAIAALGRPELGTTVVPSMASAGTASNVVPAEAKIIVDVRVASADETARIEAAFAGLRAVGAGAKVAVAGGFSRPPMPEEVSEHLFGVARQFDANLEGISVGGGSDGNLTAALGVPTLDGLGAVGGGAHADHEYIVVGAMAERARLTAHLVRYLTAPATSPAT
ncbi:M20 family metallopeptidase [Kineosporia rhizophila]|uniref:M20 family metallopeptidase n=1 Tax=Kineosporia rhizophila TaxID=84633 RepID=UPI001E2D0010|nr:M20 family metallopeptidase [Kineosporia rhizophila]MCE0540505.1 M20 family metallopeptidase [Kineosporia rhizophila]